MHEQTIRLYVPFKNLLHKQKATLNVVIPHAAWVSSLAIE